MQEDNSEKDDPEDEDSIPEAEGRSPWILRGRNTQERALK
jgi:hypothetical protein